MELRDLRLFVHLARTLHFGKTSRALHVSAPTLSRIVQRLEEEVGEPLLVRDKRSVRLTPAGERYQQFAEKVLGEWQELTRQLHQQGSLLAGTIRLYCSVTATYGYLLDLLTPFRQRYPAVDVRLETGDAAAALEKVENGECQLAIAPLPPQMADSLITLPLADAPLLWLAPSLPGNVRTLVQQTPLPWAQIPLILAERGVSRELVLAAYANAGIKPSIHAEVSGHEAIVSMVALGFGIGAVPTPVVEHSPLQRQVRLLDAGLATGSFRVGLVTRSQSLEDPLVAAFWQLAGDRRRGA